ncbi:MAG TPA: thermonuclease family protein [Chryseosolibacter sp.]|nr:thermonuclease family protein [Chryseosolibacter sp.]
MYKLILVIAAIFIQSNEFTAQVTSVQDGDTVEIMWNDQKILVRLYGVDCPEDGQGFSTKAKQYTDAVCRNKNVKVIKRTMDVHGRIIGDIILPDGKDLAKELLKFGYAWHYKEYSDDKDLAALEMEARRQKKGLWVEANPMAPWEYKKTKKS